MNMLNLLTGKEQEICIQLLIGISMPMVALVKQHLFCKFPATIIQSPC